MLSNSKLPKILTLQKKYLMSTCITLITSKGMCSSKLCVNCIGNKMYNNNIPCYELNFSSRLVFHVADNNVIEHCTNWLKINGVHNDLLALITFSSAPPEGEI